MSSRPLYGEIIQVIEIGQDMQKIEANIYLHTWVNTAFNAPTVMKTTVTQSTVWTHYILVLYKLGEKCRKQQYYIYFYFFEYSTAYYAKIVATPTVTRERYMQTSPAEGY